MEVFWIIWIICYFFVTIIHGVIHDEGANSALGDKEYPRWRHVFLFFGCLIPLWRLFLLWRKIYNNKKSTGQFIPDIIQMFKYIVRYFNEKV